MRIARWGCVALLAQGLALGAAAQEAYVVGSAGPSKWDLACGDRGCTRQTTAWRAAAGYRFNAIVAVEGFYVDLGRARSSDYSVDGSVGSTGIGVQTLIGWQFGNVDFGGKVGLASLRNDFRAASTSGYESSRAHRTELIGGMTGAYRITPTLALRLDLDLVTVALDGDALFYSRGSDVTTLLLGLAFRF